MPCVLQTTSCLRTWVCRFAEFEPSTDDLGSGSVVAEKSFDAFACSHHFNIQDIQE
jgi:hypothetical protein